MPLILPYSSQLIINSQGGKIGSGGVIAIGTAGSTGNPPAPLAVIFTDGTGATQAQNPFFADDNGNYTFFATSGVYVVGVQFGEAAYSFPVTVGAGV